MYQVMKKLMLGNFNFNYVVRNAEMSGADDHNAIMSQSVVRARRERVRESH